MPYKIGIFTAVGSGLISIPLIFHLDTVLFFNENFVTTGWYICSLFCILCITQVLVCTNERNVLLYYITEVPGDEDLETALEVASWAWNWVSLNEIMANFLYPVLKFVLFLKVILHLLLDGTTIRTD